MSTAFVALDKYANDPHAWRDWGQLNYAASKYLFNSGNPFLYFSAATLAHLALETYLKALLIHEGKTVFNPDAVHKLNPSIGLKKPDCVWDHRLVELAKLFSSKQPNFNLSS